MSERFTALLATARIANVPSVISNVAAGVLLGSALGGAGFDWPWALTLAGVFFYVAGNFFNDWQDRHWDRHYRPERALPRGLFDPSDYLVAALSFSLVGLGLTAIYGLECLIVALGLLSLIALYTKIHKQTVYAVIPMGMCRACLPLLGYLAVQRNLLWQMWLPAAALLMYVVALSWSARWESRGDIPPAKKWQARAFLILAGLIAAAYPTGESPWLGWIGLTAFGAWLALCFTKYQKPVPAHVSALLAGIPLVDWALLFPLALILLRDGSVGFGGPWFWIALLLAPLAFVAGRLLQRVAPAT